MNIRPRMICFLSKLLMYMELSEIRLTLSQPKSLSTSEVRFHSKDPEYKI